MPALSELWGMDEASLDSLIQRGGPAPQPASACTGGDPAGLSLLGDRMLAGNCAVATHSVEVPAPPERIWPWLAQMMRGGGIYGWDALETPGCRSAEHLLSGLPLPRLGDQVTNCLILAGLKPGEEIVWAASEPLRILGHELSGLTLDYAVLPITEGNGRSRLLARLRFASPGMTTKSASAIRHALEMLLISSQLRRLREIIEHFEDRAEGGRAPVGNGSRHQKAPFKPALSGSVMSSRKRTAS